MKPGARATTVLGWSVILLLGWQGVRGLAEVGVLWTAERKQARGLALAATADERWRAHLGDAFEPFDAIRRTVPETGRVFVVFQGGTIGTLQTHRLRIALYPIDIRPVPTRGQARGGFRLDGQGDAPGPGDFMLDLDGSMAEGAFPELELATGGVDYGLYRVRPDASPAKDPGERAGEEQ